MICLYLHDKNTARRFIAFLLKSNFKDADQGLKLLLNVYDAKISEDAADLEKAGNE